MTKLGTLKKGQRGRILSVSPPENQEGQPESGIIERLLEMGLVEGSEVEILHEAPFGKDPIAVGVRGALIGLRRQEANYIDVEELSE